LAEILFSRNETMRGPGESFRKLFFAGTAYPIHHQVFLLDQKAFGKLNRRNNNRIQAIDLSAAFAREMGVIIEVMSFTAVSLAQSILNAVIGCRYGMDNAFFNKNLQGSVNRSAIKTIVHLPFYIVVGHTRVFLLKEIQDPDPGLGDA
jgi:hypothetical protein